MKKLFKVLLVALMVLCLVACGKKEEPAAEPTVGGGDLVIYSPNSDKLIEAAEKCFWAGFEAAKPGNRVSDISYAIQTAAEKRGYSIVREYQGHGIGLHMHEEPGIPNFGKPGKGPRLIPGMTLAIEPMINQGEADVEVLDDGWTVVTYDGKLSAHYENTVYIGKNGPEVLTNL